MAGGPPIDVPFIDLYLYLFLLIDLLEITGVIPDPLSLILSLFSGRPKPEATAEIANWLMKARNPAARIWGIEIGRYLVEAGAVLSDGHPDVQAVYEGFRNQFIDNMLRQGFGVGQVNAIVALAMSRAAQAGAPYPPELEKNLPKDFHLGGPQTIETLYNDGIQKGTALGLAGEKLINYAQKYVLQHATLQQLHKIRVGNPQKCGPGYHYDWISDTCIQGTPIPICPDGSVWDPTTAQCIPAPGGVPQCPPGYTWDPNSESCKVIPIIPPQPCPPGFQWDPQLGECVPIEMPIPPPDPDPDELSACCEASVAALNELVIVAQQVLLFLQGMPGSQPQTDCCTKLVAAIAQVVDAIALLTNNLPADIDLTAIDSDLQAIHIAIANIPNALQTIQQENAPLIKAAADEIAKAIASAPATDVSGIVDQLKNLVAQGDVKQSILDYLVQNGFIDPALGQVIAGAPWADAIIGYFRTMFWNGLSTWWRSIGIAGPPGKFTPGPLSSTITNDISTAIQTALNTTGEPIYPVIKGIIDGVVSVLNPRTPTLPADIGVDFDLVLSKTLAPALIVNGIALLASYFGWDVAESLREYVDLVTGFVGLEEVRELKVGQRMRFGPMRVAELQAKALYRQELPGFAAMANLAARGLYSPARASALRPLTGLPDELEKPLQEAAYQGLNPRMLINLMQTGLFSATDFQDEMTFSGMRPASQKRMLLVAPYLATQSERSSARAALEAQYVAGFIDQNGLVAQLDSLEQNTDRDSLVMVRVNAQKIVQEGKALETEYTTMYIGNLISDATYRNYLSAIGLQPDMVNIIAGRAEARANATLLRKNLAEAARQAKETAHLEQRAALQSFKDGLTDASVLTAALIATGLSPVQAAAWTSQAELLRSGSVRWLYGLQLQPAQATQLRARVTALTDQRKKQLITETQYVDGLKALGISPRWINALDAAAEASLTPKTAAFAVPVETN